MTSEAVSRVTEKPERGLRLDGFSYRHGRLHAEDVAIEKIAEAVGTPVYVYSKQAIGRAIDDKARTIRIPIHMAERVRRIRRASRELGRELGRTPTPAELSETRVPLPNPA